MTDGFWWISDHALDDVQCRHKRCRRRAWYDRWYEYTYGVSRFFVNVEGNLDYPWSV